MAVHPNVARVRAAYDAFAKGDLETVLKDLAPDAVFHFGGEGPLSGDHEGPDAIGKALIGTFEVTGGTQALDIKGIYADDQHAVVVLHETATRAADNKKLAIDEVHVITLNAQGQITNLWDLPEDAAIHDAFFDGR